MLDRKFLRKAALITGSVFLGLFALYFLFRGFVFDKVLERIEEKLLVDYQLKLTIDGVDFSGTCKINFQGIKLVKHNEPALFEADSMSIEPSLSALMTGELRIKSFYLAHAKLFLNCKDGLCNYPSFLKKQTKQEKNSSQSELNYSSFMNRLLRRAFNYAPQQSSVFDLEVEYLSDSIHEQIRIPFYEADKNKLAGVVEDENSRFQWAWNGSFSQRDEKFDITVFPLSSSTQQLPVIKSLFQLGCSFDTVHLALNDLHYGNGRLDLSGHFSTENLKIYHTRISGDTVRLVHVLFDSRISVNAHSMSLDSSSSLQLNSIHVQPYLSFKNEKSKVIDMSIRTAPLEVTDFFYSLPEGMFEEVRDVEGDGTLEYSLDFHFDAAEPDSVIFNSSLKKSRFHLTKFGDGKLLKMNAPFIHSVYENDRLVRSYEVGPGNPFYTSLDSISPLFQASVLTSEDGNFYFHNGFNEDAFRKSIATNFKAGRFERGGSTISMQLVKNVFLTRKKTIARKAEEALIVWLIESNRLVSKPRMFEVYLNIIELGPGIYGIGEAAYFYFAKKPSELDLAESIFLAHLLPHPKWYRSSFDEQGQLKTNLTDYYRVMSNFMLKKNLISQEQYDNLKPEVILNGPARDLIIRQDSTLNISGEGENDMGE